VKEEEREKNAVISGRCILTAMHKRSEVSPMDHFDKCPSAGVTNKGNTMFV
jgi:hypothetical protein